MAIGSLQDLAEWGVCEGWLENVNQFVDGKFWVDGQAYQCQYKDYIASDVEHTSIGTFGLKTDQHTISGYISPWLPTPKYIPKMTLTSASLYRS